MGFAPAARAKKRRLKDNKEKHQKNFEKENSSQARVRVGKGAAMGKRWVVAALVIIFCCLAISQAHADINNSGLLDNVIRRYSNAASSWVGVIRDAASRLFWTLVLISMVWTFGMMALRQAGLQEFFAEFLKFTITTGFFWWLLTNGPNFADSIIRSLRILAGSATGLGDNIYPSEVVDIGFNIFFSVLKRTSAWKPVDSTALILIAVVVLVILALVAVNMLLLIVSSWILTYAGIFFLGFGGSKWTSDMAIGYYRSVLSIAAQLLVMGLLIGIGQGFINDYYQQMAEGLRYGEMGVLLVASIVLLALVSKVPPMIGQLAFGGGGGGGVGTFGAGAALGAAGALMSGAAMAGAMAKAAATGMAGGAQALIAAYKQAGQNVSEGSDILSGFAVQSGDASPAGSASEAAGSEAGLAKEGGQASGGGAFSASTTSGAGDNSSSQAASNTSPGDGASEIAGGETPASPPGIQASEGGGATSSSPPGIQAGEAGGISSATATNGAGDPGRSANNGKNSSTSGKTRMPTKRTRIAADTAANLIKGAYDVAKGHIANTTTGGKIAAAIKKRAGDANQAKEAQTNQENQISKLPEFNGDSLQADPEQEIAAFVSHPSTGAFAEDAITQQDTHTRRSG